jgi:hypothetical protein
MAIRKRDARRCPICGELLRTDSPGTELFEVRACEKRCDFGALRTRIKGIEAKALRQLRRPNPPNGCVTDALALAPVSHKRPFVGRWRSSQKTPVFRAR